MVEPSTKYCVNCKHYSYSIRGHICKIKRKKGTVDLVTGKYQDEGFGMSKYDVLCREERDTGICGEDGLYFEQKQVET